MNEKRQRANWNKEMLVRALELIKQGKSRRYAPEKSSVPRRTLRNHLKTKSTQRKLGSRTILTEEQEAPAKL